MENRRVNQPPGKGGAERPGGGGSRGTQGQHGGLDQGARTGQADNESGGREGPSEIPNPDNVNDRGSLSGFDGNAAEDTDEDGVK